MLGPEHERPTGGRIHHHALLTGGRDRPGFGCRRHFRGGSHTCAVAAAGAAKCWGYNAVGSLGDGSTTRTTAGAVRCWGYNAYGAVGDGTTISRSTPSDVVGLDSGVTRVSMGVAHACALLSVGTVKCWGTGSALGNGLSGSAQYTRPSDSCLYYKPPAFGGFVLLEPLAHVWYPKSR